MAKDQQPAPSQQPQPQPQSPTPIPATEMPAAPPSTPAPNQPSPGAAVTQPMTGAGKKPEHEEELRKRQQKEAKDKQPPQAPKTLAVPPIKPKPVQPAQPRGSPQPSPALAISPPSTHDQPALQSLVEQVLNSQRSADQKFYLLVLPEDDWPRHESFTDVQALVLRIKELLGTPCHLFPFMGHKLTITSGPNRFLQTPLGALPLFDIPPADAVEETEHGWVGPSMDRPEIPQEVDEDFDDEDDPGEPAAQITHQPADDDEGDTPVFEA